MSISHTLKEYLDRERVRYEVLSHPEAFRAVAIAQTLHTLEKAMAKIVIVKVDEQFVMTGSRPVCRWISTASKTCS